jgi:hypothetical protein
MNRVRKPGPKEEGGGGEVLISISHNVFIICTVLFKPQGVELLGELPRKGVERSRRNRGRESRFNVNR